MRTNNPHYVYFFFIGFLIPAAVALTLWLSMASARVQLCPTFAVGEPVVVRDGSVFEGRTGVVFQPGTFADGLPGYVVRLENPLAYLGISGCELQRYP